MRMFEVHLGGKKVRFLGSMTFVGEEMTQGEIEELAIKAVRQHLIIEELFDVPQR